MRISVKDYSVTLISGVAVSFYSFIILKLVLVNYGEQALEFFSILKRYQSFLVPIMLLGFGVTLPKYLAMKKISGKIIFLCLFMVIAVFFLFLACFYFFWKEYYLAVLLCFPVLIAGFLYSIARGLNLFTEGSLVNIFFLVILPTIVFVLVDNVELYVVAYFLVSVCIFFVMLFVIRKYLFSINVPQTIPKKIFLVTSFMRVPGDFLNQAILMLPVQLYIYNNDMMSAAQLSIALSVVVAFAIPLKPLSTILLVKVAMAELNPAKNKTALLYYCVLGIALALIYRCFTWVFNDFYFESEEFLFTLNMLTPLVFFYSVYVLSRSYIDALFSGPVLTYVNLFALVFGLIVFWVFAVEPWVIASVSYGCATIVVVLLILVKKHE